MDFSWLGWRDSVTFRDPAIPELKWRDIATLLRSERDTSKLEFPFFASPNRPNVLLKQNTGASDPDHGTKKRAQMDSFFRGWDGV